MAPVGIGVDLERALGSTTPASIGIARMSDLGGLRRRPDDVPGGRARSAADERPSAGAIPCRLGVNYLSCRTGMYGLIGTALDVAERSPRAAASSTPAFGASRVVGAARRSSVADGVTLSPTASRPHSGR